MPDPKNHPLTLSGMGAGRQTQASLSLPPLGAAAPVVAPPEGAPPGLDAAPTASSLLQALRRRWLLAFGLAGIAATAAVFAVLTLLPAQYSAHVRIQIAPRSSPGIFIPGPNDENDFLIYKASMASLIKSPLVVNAALNQVKDLEMVREKAKPVPWLETALRTDFLLAPDTLRVTLSGDDPEEVSKVLNAVTDAFVKELENREKVKRQYRLDELKHNQRTALETLHQKRRAFNKRLLDEKLDDPEIQKDRYRQFLADLGTTKKTFLDKQLEQIGAENDLRGLEYNLLHLDKLPVSEIQIDEYLKADPSAQQMLVELAQIEKDIVQIEKVANDPKKIEPFEEKKAAQRNRLGKLREKLRPDLERKIRADMSDKMRLQVIYVKEKISGLVTQQQSLRTELQMREEEGNRMKNNPLPLDMAALRDEIHSLSEAQKKMNEMIAALEAEPLLGRITMLQRAEPPTARDFARQSKFAGVAGIGMFGLLLLGVSWWEFRARRVNAATDVVDGLKMSLVGTLPGLPESARKPVSTSSSPRDLQWQGQLAEAVDSIRTMLLHSARSESLHVVMVTSALQGEGKTSLASQLAASLARAWRKTLLVDGDLRNPAAHKLFGLPQEPGLSEVLRSEINPADAIRATSLSRLWLLPAGQWDSHAVQALAQEGVREMFQQFKEQYDFVIVDSCPVLPVADALLLAQNVDAVIFSILRDVSRVPAVYSAQQKLNNLGIRTLGAVVIGEQPTDGYGAYAYPCQTQAAG